MTATELAKVLQGSPSNRVAITKDGKAVAIHTANGWELARFRTKAGGWDDNMASKEKPTISHGDWVEVTA